MGRSRQDIPIRQALSNCKKVVGQKASWTRWLLTYNQPNRIKIEFQLATFNQILNGKSNSKCKAMKFFQKSWGGFGWRLGWQFENTPFYHMTLYCIALQLRCMCIELHCEYVPTAIHPIICDTHFMCTQYVIQQNMNVDRNIQQLFTALKVP